jgi:hypothetical protein
MADVTNPRIEQRRQCGIQRFAEERDLAGAVAGMSVAMIFSSVLLPAPLAPDQRDVSPLLDLEVDLSQDGGVRRWTW